MNNVVHQIAHLFHFSFFNLNCPFCPYHLPPFLPPTVHPTPVIQPPPLTRVQSTVARLPITRPVPPPRVQPTTKYFPTYPQRVQVPLLKQIPAKNFHPNTSISRSNRQSYNALFIIFSVVPHVTLAQFMYIRCTACLCTTHFHRFVCFPRL